LVSAPFNLPWGSSIYAVVKAINAYGSSAVSPAGNGAVILTKPNPPANFIENLAQKSKTEIGLDWETPTFVGGSSVIDYKLFIA